MNHPKGNKKMSAKERDILLKKCVEVVNFILSHQKIPYRPLKYDTRGQTRRDVLHKQIL